MQEDKIRTEAVKIVLTCGLSMATIKACRELTEPELEFLRVYLELNQAPPRARRSDAGKTRTKPDQRSIAEISRGSESKAS